METKLVKITEENRQEIMDEAARLLKEGRVVSIPTETVYGLAANVFNDEAVKEIFEIKGRPGDNPLIVHVSDLIMLKNVAAVMPKSASTLAKLFWPGPLTMVLPKTEAISDVVTCGLPTVAVRMPEQATAVEIIRRAGLPLAMPSANLSGRPSPTTARHVWEDLNGLIPLIVDDGLCAVGVESTVISLAGDVPTILRPGIISLEELRAALPETVLSDAVLQAVSDDAQVESPGMKYRHYAPKAILTLVCGTLEQFIDYAHKNAAADTYAMCFEGEEEMIGIPSMSYGDEHDPKTQARRLFSVLRAVDQFGASSVFVRCPARGGAGLAVFNRLLRAAGNRVVEF